MLEMKGLPATPDRSPSLSRCNLMGIVTILRSSLSAPQMPPRSGFARISAHEEEES